MIDALWTNSCRINKKSLLSEAIGQEILDQRYPKISGFSDIE